MENIYVSNLRFEQCTNKKEIIDLIMPRTSIHYIIDGNGYFNNTRLGAGDFFCAVKNTKVCYHPDVKSPWSYIYADLYGENLLRILNRYGFTSRNCTGSFDYRDEIIKLEQLYQQHDKKAGYNKDFLCSIANLILSLQKINNKDISTSSYHVNEIKTYLDLNFHKKISIAELANQFFLSRAYIRNIFYEYLKMSPKQYLQNLRMNKAAELLANTSYKVSLISISVGYADQLAFSKAFKQFFGVSPLKYRSINSQQVQ